MSSDSQSNNKRIAKNTIYMYLRMMVMLVVSLFTAGIVFNTLGIDDYGIYNIVGSIVVFFTFLNNGLTQATRRFITAELATGTPESQRNVFNMSLVSHAIIACVVFVLAETIGLWGVNYFLNIPEERMFAANIAFQVSVLTTLFNVMQAPYTAAITANEKMNVYAYFSIFEIVLKLMLIAAVVYIDYDKLIVYSIMICIVSIINIMLYRVYCRLKFQMCKLTRPHGRQLLKEMFGFTGWSLMGQGVVVLNNQGVTVLINMFFSVAANAAMGVSNQITNIVNQFVSNFQIAFNPQITKLYVKQEYNELINLVLRSSRFSSYLIMVFMIPICFQIDNFLSLWLGDYPQYTVEFCIFTLMAIFIDCLAAPLWMVLGSDKDIKTYQIVVSTLYSFNFIGSWIALYCGMPPYSVILVRICVFAITLVARLILTKGKVSVFSIGRWVKDVLLRSLIIVSIPAVVMVFVNKIEYRNSIIELIANSCIAFLLTVMTIYTLGLTKNERAFFVEKIKKFKLGH